jgi:hypothetical protein
MALSELAGCTSRLQQRIRLRIVVNRDASVVRVDFDMAVKYGDFVDAHLFVSRLAERCTGCV